MKVIFTLFIMSFSTLAAQTPTFNNLYGNEGSAKGMSIAVVESGGYIAYGNNRISGPGGFSFYLVRTNSFGDTLWTRFYGGAWFDEATSVSPTSDGGFLITGIFGEYDIQGQGLSSAYLGKVDGQGNLEWELILQGFWGNVGAAAFEDDDGNYLFAGTLTLVPSSGTPAAFLAKVNQNGQVLWRQDYPGYAYIESAIACPDGGYMLAGRRYGGPTSLPLLIKTNREGDTLWTKTTGWGINYGLIHQVINTQDGNYVVTGTRVIQSDQDGFVAKITPEGDLVWRKTYGGSEDDLFISIAEHRNGDFSISGLTYSNTPTQFTNSDIWLLRTNSLGDTIWSTHIGGGGYEEGHGVAATPDGGLC